MSNWVYNKKEDLTWLILPCFASFLIIIIYNILPSIFNISAKTAVIIVYLIWVIFFDSTHLFATYTRTFFDRHFYFQNRSMLLKSFLVFAIGPALIICAFLFFDNLTQITGSFIVFTRFAIIYAYYHVIKQHWGFIAIYRKKNDEISLKSRKLDELLLFFGTIFPLASGNILKFKIFNLYEKILISNAEWKLQAVFLFTIGITLLLLFYILNKLFKNKYKQLAIDKIGIIAIISSLIISFILIFSLKTLFILISIFCALGFIISLTKVFYLPKKDFDLWINNKPKLFFMGIVIVAYNIIFHMNIPLLIIIAAITVFHNIQYNKVVHHHNIKNYKSKNKKKYGTAVLLISKTSVFLGFLFLFDIVTLLPQMSTHFIKDNLLFHHILSTFFWGIAFHHYFLDSVIWKIKDNKVLQKSFNIPTKN